MSAPWIRARRDASASSWRGAPATSSAKDTTMPVMNVVWTGTPATWRSDAVWRPMAVTATTASR